MLKHHEESIKIIIEQFKKKDEVLGIIIGGSIAHGFEREDSDIDIMIVISDKDHDNLFKTGSLHYLDKEICTYESGYIDGKYISIEFMRKVASFGSEPARFAFQGAFAAFSRVDEIEKLLKAITRYPVELKNERIRQFYTQLEAWKWFCGEALKYNNKYLLNHSVSNLILFGGRLILAYNETLYPYHKWLMKVLQNIKHKPDTMMNCINNLLENPNKDNIDAFYKCIIEFTDWGIAGLNWPNMFMKDTELSWLCNKVPIADI